MEDERTVPALVSVYKAEVWRHLGFCGNVRPVAAARVKSLCVGCGGQQGRSRVGGTVAKSIIRDFGLLFFVKLRKKIPGRGLRFFGLILQNMVAC